MSTGLASSQSSSRKASLSASVSAGFPVLAGLDQHARVNERQFVEFQQQFRHTLEMLRSISSLWNRQDPCIISGFDMDRTQAANALAGQPLGTFVCRFSMNQRGTLVLSVKVCARVPLYLDSQVVLCAASP